MGLYSNVNAFFLIWFVAIFAVAFFGFSNFPKTSIYNGDFLSSFSNWDGKHYLEIAQNGYTEKIQYAFFPLYPLLIKLLNNLLENYLLSALLISYVSSFLGLHFLYKLIREDFGENIAQNSILFLLFFPTSFFFLTVYTEGLFFLLVVLTFYYLKKSNLLLATIFALFSSATRLVGIAVILGLLVEIYTKRGINRKNWYVLLSPAGLILYCYFLFTQTGDPFYFLTAELAWQRSLTIPGVGFWESLKQLAIPGFITNHFNIFLDLVIAIFAVGFSIRAFRFLPPAYSVYCLVSLAIPLLTPTLLSIPRFTLVIFPIFILLSMIKNSYFILFYQVVSLMLLSAYILLFVNGYWVS